MKRIIAFMLSVVMLISVIPAQQLFAADSSDDYYFELDTDGIDAGAEYLIVSAKADGSAQALRNWYNTVAAERVTISGQTIAKFTNAESCTWTFGGADNGTVKNGSRYLQIRNSITFSTTESILSFAHFGEGTYGVYVKDSTNSALYYLRYNMWSWRTETNTGQNASGTNLASYKSCVYLFKKITMQTVSYNGMGNTSGTVPEKDSDLKTGTQYTVKAPSDNFLKIDEDNNVYLFVGWTMQEDGTGKTYLPGDTISIGYEDVTLYAKWQMQLQYTVTVRTNLDNEPTDVEQIEEEVVGVYVSQDETPTANTKYIELVKKETGTYVATVNSNGTYYIYVKLSDGSFEQAHGHKVVIYNQNGDTVLQNYSVTYDTGVEDSQMGTLSWKDLYHAYSKPLVMANIPEKLGYVFVGWQTKDGKMLTQGDAVTESIQDPIVLTAVWEKAASVTVNITIDHNSEKGGVDNSAEKGDVTFQLLQWKQETGVNLPIEGGLVHLMGAKADEKGVSRYTYEFDDLEQGENVTYHVSTVKSGYEITEMTTTRNEYGAYEIDVKFRYAPTDFDLTFEVQMAEGATASLYPKAVNVKVSYWGYNSQNILGWHIITQQAGDEAPTTVVIEPETGKGTAFFPVWKYWSESNDAYEYRVEVTSYVLPDGRIVAANAANMYSSTVDIELNDELPGRVPAYPAESNTNLAGAYYNGSEQAGLPVITIDTHSYMVTFDAGTHGTINGQDVLYMGEQYKYPNLNEYVPVAKDPLYIFDGWYIGNTKAENLAGEYLTSDVTYTAKWKSPRRVNGRIEIDVRYQEEGQDEDKKIHDRDRAQYAMVVLQKLTNGVYNDTESQLVEFFYYYDDEYTPGETRYSFVVPDDGAEYQIQVLVLNYTPEYNNNGDGMYSAQENKIVFKNGVSSVHANLHFTPESYMQVSRVDASQIHKDYRPTGVLAKIIYRDLGVSGSTYEVISQHYAEDDGMQMVLNANGEAFSEYSIWKWHTDGMLYEYQLELFELYGNVSGVFAEDGSIEYSSLESPYTIRYAQSSWWDNEADGAPAIEATLIPKEYNITFDLNLGDGSNDTVLGMEQFITDDGNSGYYYSYAHTWSYEDDLIAFPYREGYIFEGWVNEKGSNGVYINNGGYVTVGAGLAEEVTLKAKWKKLDGNCYTVRYLEKNTERVLHGAKVVENAQVGANIKAHDEALEISRYKYAGVMIDGTYYEWSAEPSMTVKSGTSNMMTIYYVPSDDGYTEQVESNLHLNKTATLEDDGTYTITMETYTKDNPVTTQILQNTPLDIVLVIDQSGSIYQDGYLDELQDSVDNFITLVADHGRTNEVDHRIAMVGYASDRSAGTTDSNYPFAGGEKTNEWVNTGVFDSNGDFHSYTVTGFNYTEYNGSPTADGTYYTLSDGKYLLLMHHDQYYHLITEEEAKTEALNDNIVYGYVDGKFVQVTRNHSGLWIYGNNQLYSLEEFFTYHQDVWTHRDGLGQRLIHAYGTGNNYRSIDGHSGIYTRTETTSGTPQLDVYKDALIPVSIEQNGAGRTNPHLINASERLGSNGGTYVQYGIEMANKIFEANKDTSTGRVKIMVMFTDGNPGKTGFDKTEANAAIREAYDTKNTYGAYCYTIGLYPSTGVSSTSDVSVYMNAVSSNYPKAQDMDDVYTAGSYYTVSRGTNINDGKTYYVRVRDGWSYVYLPLTYGTFRNSSGQQRTGWYYTNGNTNTLVTETKDAAVGSNGKISGTTIYGMSGGYKATDYSGYYSTTDSEANLKEYFANVMTEITTKITREIILHTDTIIRDIMGQGFVLTDGTVIKAYKQAGTYNAAKGGIDWNVDRSGNPILESVATLELLKGNKSEETVKINGQDVSYIQVYNMDAENTTNPTGDNYHPHTVDITGYDFENWYISDKHPQGYKMVVEISRVEARDDVEWGRSTATNNEQSGLWLPADAQGNRELLLAFKQPKTIFVQRSYVLDYAKTFDLKGWYLDKVDGNAKVGPTHIDTHIQTGMNWFDKTQPCINSGNKLLYANAFIQDKVVSYTPTNMNWGNVQEFYVFGNTENTTVTTQDANKNGNLWTKVNVLPANSIYYEDTFVTTESDGVKGFVYSGSWNTVYSDGEQNADKNTETPEHQEQPPYGDVHGWIDAMGDDGAYSDGSAHYVGKEGMGASVEFTFTGVGVDVYTRTNSSSGMIIATLSKIVGDIEIPQSGQMIDNLAVSGDYYHIPTLSFENLAHGTYKVKIFATAASDVATSSMRYEYYLDGIRVYSPLGENQVNASNIVKDAYANEQNAVFKEVRDVLLDYNDFNIDMTDSTDSKAGAVFIDTIKEGQGIGNDAVGVGKSTYEVGTFETYGPKNEVYLKGGQSIVLKVDKSNTYYVGLKSLDGKKVTANVSGISKAEPKQIEIAHSIDMYYQVTPIEGYIVIENASTGDEILSITKLRTTNLTEPAIDSGILPVTQQEAVMMMARFALRMNPPVYEEPEDEELGGKEPEEQKPVEKNPEENVQEKPDSGKEPSDNQIAHAGNISDNQQTTDKKPNTTPTEQNTLMDEETEEEEDIVDGNESVDEESEEAVQEENDSEESEDGEKLTFWEKILAFFKKLFYNIATWIRNLIGGDEV